MIHLNKHLASLSLDIPTLEADQEGKLHGGFKIFTGNGVEAMGYNVNCDCGCNNNECTIPNENCNSNCPVTRASASYADASLSSPTTDFGKTFLF